MIFSIFKEAKKISEVFQRINTWNNEYIIEIGKFSIKINTNDNTLSNFISSTFSNFIDFTRTTDYIFNLYTSKSYKVDIEENDNEKFGYNYVRFFDTFFYYRLHKNNPVIDVLMPKKFEDWEFENFFKLFISSRSLYFNSLMIHASAIVLNDEVVLFTGQSTAGKSTIAALSGHEIIHDDNLLISHMGDGIFRFETIPFKIPYQKKCFEGKIRGFYRLYQDDKTFINEIDTNKQFTNLLFSLWAFDNFQCLETKGYNNKVMSYCKEILPYLKMKDLHFTKTRDFLELI